jgi:hypothetical protein
LRAEDFLLMPLAKLKLLYALRCLTYCRASTVAAHQIRPTSRSGEEEPDRPALGNSQGEVEDHLVDMLLTKKLEIGPGNKILMHDPNPTGKAPPTANTGRDNPLGEGRLPVGVSFLLCGDVVHLAWPLASSARSGVAVQEDDAGECCSFDDDETLRGE